jgi:hypothetical protein
VFERFFARAFSAEQEFLVGERPFRSIQRTTANRSRLLPRLEVDRLGGGNDLGALLLDRVNEFLRSADLDHLTGGTGTSGAMLLSAAAARKSAAIFSFSSFDRV